MAYPNYGGDFAYGGRMAFRPRDGLIRDGDEEWLDHLETLTFRKSCCLSGSIAGRTRGGESIKFERKSGGCSGGTYHAVVEGDGNPVAIFGVMGGCSGGARYTQCPPGREVLTAIIRKEGHGTHGETFYTSHIRNGKGAGGMLIRHVMNGTDCGGSLPFCDVTGRILADIEGPRCCSCCGGLINVKFDESATAIEKLAVIDHCLAVIDTTLSNPYHWLCLFVFLAIPVTLAIIILLLWNAGIISETTTASSGFNDRHEAMKKRVNEALGKNQG